MLLSRLALVVSLRFAFAAPVAGQMSGYQIAAGSICLAIPLISFFLAQLRDGLREAMDADFVARAVAQRLDRISHPLASHNAKYCLAARSSGDPDALGVSAGRDCAVVSRRWPAGTRTKPRQYARRRQRSDAAQKLVFPLAIAGNSDFSICVGCPFGGLVPIQSVGGTNSIASINFTFKNQ